MAKDKTPKKQAERGLNIAKGVVAQEALRDAMNAVGIKAGAQIKSYRDEDKYDFRVSSNGADLTLSEG
jgi:hypothetical protein